MGLFNKVKVRVHVAHFVGKGRKDNEYYFINVVNSDKVVTREITHIWIQTGMGYNHRNAYYPLNPERPLPYRLSPQAEWETWVNTKDIPSSMSNESLYDKFFVRLSNGKIIRSKMRVNVPAQGTVPGGKKE